MLCALLSVISQKQMFVCSDVQKCGFTKCLPLPQATVFDSILCADVSDVNWDGKNEIILGTFGKVCVN